MDGVLVLHKPSGITSHDAVLRVRRMIGYDRIGHTGTLDPLATGVLVLCIGKATRIASYLEAGEKEYHAILRLGVTTDTLDAEGNILETKSYIPPDDNHIKGVFKSFLGTIHQQPPAYSAIKIAGVRSYKLAREGKAVSLSPRAVTIHALEVTAYNDPFIHFTVRCSKGVYIRSLCADIGTALGMGAHLTRLIRTRSGHFSLEKALTFEMLAELWAKKQIQEALISLDDSLQEFPAISVEPAESVRILHGNSIPWHEPAMNPVQGLVRVHDSSKRLLALGRLEQGMLKPKLVLVEFTK
ncbi:MAG: tRNA pseudouridine(55) synthase TruB [Nitrospirota bacterium]